MFKIRRSSREGQQHLNLVLLALLLIAVWLLGRWSAGGRKTSEEARGWDSGPVVMAIQKIGQLHAASYTMKDILHQESQQNPNGWASDLPGAAEVVHWATHNEALVAAEGTVEAGVDLARLSAKDVTQVKRPDGKTITVVHLPPVTIYPPVVHLHVVHTQNALFWRDENIIPSAQARAGQLFLTAAEQSGIREKAQANTIQTLQAMERALGHPDIEFNF